MNFIGSSILFFDFIGVSMNERVSELAFSSFLLPIGPVLTNSYSVSEGLADLTKEGVCYIEYGTS